MRVLPAIGWVGVALLLWPWQTPEVDARPIGQRLTGPVASLLASWEWVRFEEENREGRPERAQLHADRALALDPISPEGWITLGNHFLFTRASALNEPDPAARARWMRAGLDVWARGQARCSQPAQLAMLRGRTLTMYVAVLAAEPQLEWPGGVRAARLEAREVLLEAVALGAQDAHELLAALRRAVESEAAAARETPPGTDPDGDPDDQD